VVSVASLDPMRHPFVNALLVSAFVVSSQAAVAQQAAPPFPAFQPVITATRPAGELSSDRRALNVPSWSDATASHRGRHALIGGLIGAAAGVITCTVISNVANDPGTGFSTCDATAYVGFGLGGFAVGALIGWLI
jgi:hypothetical protein